MIYDQHIRTVVYIFLMNVKFGEARKVDDAVLG